MTSDPNYRGILTRFLWFAEKNNWSDDVRLINEWQIREFLGYVGTEKNRWEKQGKGAESSSRKSSSRTVHHYYGALRAFFNWMVREGFVKETPLAKVKVQKTKPRVIQPYSVETIRKIIQVCDHDYEHGSKFLGRGVDRQR